MLPPAPVTFSMTTACPSDRRMGSVRIRARVSVGPPGANGTIMVIGRLGYLCAQATDATQAVRSAVMITRRRSRFFMMFVLRPFNLRQSLRLRGPECLETLVECAPCMKFLFDFFPVALFFVAIQIWD